MLCTHHVGPCWQGMTVPEAFRVQGASDELAPPVPEPAATGVTACPPDSPLPASTTQMPCESYCWQAAGSAAATVENTPWAHTPSSTPTTRTVTRRMTAPAGSGPR